MQIPRSPPPRSPTSLLQPPPPPTGGFAVALNLVSPEPPHPAAFGLESEQIARPSHPPAALISLGRAVRGPAKRGTMPSLPRHLISSSPFCSFSGSHSGPPRSPSTAHSRLRPPSAGISHAPHSSASAPSVARPSPMAFSKVASPPLTRLQACPASSIFLYNAFHHWPYCRPLMFGSWVFSFPLSSPSW